ncbi:hypothetical protein LOTGIDRAFT_175641 [Lottia gigantea]|uniref:Major facilitator superfamily (MFS) profile domain-containing protein n=1 Tax=Lottia gigantea TaxID=225164 RepID=V4A893_LOTGI|nr:hypothetical protein LOTGIDRAFT_175641 [Lottia gigantea]ESO92932.1 hypothetical protein LOTGIDRAFT_175641 [Lottia gigantea]
MVKVTDNFKKWYVLIGSIAIHFCIGVPFLFGNLLTYIVSYMHYRGFYNASNIGDENWIVSPYPAGLAISSTIAGSMRQKVGVRFTLLISNLVFSAGYFLTYISLEHSLWLPILTYGFICGLGTGAAYVTTIDICSKYFRNHVSTITSILIAGFSCGAAVFNQVVSFYVNPDNHTPDVHLGSIK